MAEQFGILSGALSIAGLFNNCVECFEYVRFGRQFEPDFDRCQLRLDILKTRLGRWGEAIKVNEDQQFADKPETGRLVASILQDIERLFKDARRMSEEYTDPVPLDVNNMALVPKTLHNQLKSVTDQRQKRTNLLKRTEWALCDKTVLEGTVKKIDKSIRDLEELFPEVTKDAYGKLAKFEIEEMKDEPSLTRLNDAAEGIDTILSEATAQKLGGIRVKNHAHDVEAVGSISTAQVGEKVAKGSSVSRVVDITNSADTVRAKEKGEAHVGNTWG